MIDFGCFLYVYDCVKFFGGFVVWKVRDGEQVVVFNGKIYMFDVIMIVIVDDVGVYDIGGIMGGEYLGVFVEIIEVLIECVYFDFDYIVCIGQKLMLIFDVCSWFECGVDLVFFEDGLVIVIVFVFYICGGIVSEVM